MIPIDRPAAPKAVEQAVAALRRRYPVWQAAPIGASVRGRPLWALALDQGEETVVIAAAFHGQEWITSWVALRLCADIAKAWEEDRPLAGLNVRRAAKGRRLAVVPQVNPDGVALALEGAVGWQANARGVDLNHNYPAGWESLRAMEKAAGITGPSARQWGGPCPASEPETKAMMHLCRRLKPRHVVALHTQGEEIYWQYGPRTPERSRLMAQVMADASGYRVAAPAGLASHGGFKDWFIEQTGRPGFTLEMGKGVNPLPLSGFEGLYRKAMEMLLLAAFM
ncbi:MAG: M14 family metallopeptidase [Acutalibacteraceae bacterium]|jgi:g-D-glutamyl-meso-diaminopimelate peptidase